MEPQTTIIEINGVKMEIDLRHAKRVDTLRVGSRVKCLVKQYSDHKIFPGIVIGFEPFEKLPSIKVCYINESYGAESLTFQTFNTETKDFEIVADLDYTALEVDRNQLLKKFARDIGTKEREIQELKDKREFFIEKFGAYFTDIKEETQDA